MKKSLLFLAVFLLLVSSVFAVELTSDVVQDETLPGGSISYVLHINNNEGKILYVDLKTADLNWLMDQNGQTATIASGKTKDFTITFKPFSGEQIRPGNYGIKVLVSTQLTKLEKLLTARVLNYNEVIDSSFVGSSIVDPRRDAVLRLNVSNLHLVELKALSLELKSSHFQFTRTLDLSKKASVILEFPISLDPSTTRGEYQANVKVNLRDKVMLDKQIPYTIQEYQDIKELVVPNGGFLLGGELITKENIGNTPTVETVSRTFNWFSYRFASFDPQPTRVNKTDEGTVVQWDVSLNPKQTVTVSYAVNYRLLTAVILLIIIALIAWYYIRQKNAIVLTKRIFAMHTEAGNVKIMKVVLNIRNRGGINVNNVRIVDKVPSIIKAPTQHGMLRPTHVKAAPEGTVMVWDLPSVKPGEEKVISYRIEGKINLLGRLVLPYAIAKYVLFGRSVSARSSTVSLSEKK